MMQHAEINRRGILIPSPFGAFSLSFRQLFDYFGQTQWQKAPLTLASAAIPLSCYCRGLPGIFESFCNVHTTTMCFFTFCARFVAQVFVNLFSFAPPVPFVVWKKLGTGLLRQYLHLLVRIRGGSDWR